MNMKKLLLFSLALMIGAAGFAQKKAVIRTDLAKKSTVVRKVVTADQDLNSIQSVPLKRNPLSITDDYIGNTYYDLQTNKCVQNRIVKHADGTISATWTMGTGTFADRGTGYNYFDGSNWDSIPTARLEAAKNGWPSMTVANGKEVVISHMGSGLTLTTRTKGTGAWTSATIPFTSTENLTWPRAMGKSLTSGVIHLIAENYTGTVANGMVYSRSQDGGATWDIMDSILPGVDPVTEMLPPGGDAYTLYVKGDTVGIVAGDMTTDVVLMKSFDGGTTWSKQIVWQHQIPLWNTSIVGAAGSSDVNGDGLADTITVTDGRYAVAVDNDGVFHVFMGITKILRDSTTAADNFSFWPYTDGLVYWNSSMAAIVPGYSFNADQALNIVGYMVDVNGNDTIDFNTPLDPTTQYPFGDFSFTSLSSMPSAAIGDDGAIYCTYSSLVEGTDFGDDAHRGFRNIYAIKSSDGGSSFSAPVNITPSDYKECLYGSLNKKVDSYLYMVYQNSLEPGTYLQPSSSNPHVEQETYTNVVKVSNDLVVNSGISELPQNSFTVEQNYPNPFNGSATLEVYLDKSSDLSMTITNLIGQTVSSTNFGTVNKGKRTLTIDGSKLTSGIYFYTVKAGTQTVTKKMIVQ
jgi:hypothetical protein